jgi:hypothetical protein
MPVKKTPLISTQKYDNLQKPKVIQRRKLELLSFEVEVYVNKQNKQSYSIGHPYLDAQLS